MMLAQKRIPTLLALFILVVGLGTAVFITEFGSNVVSKATSTNPPQQLRISNITDSSVTISWLTTEKTTGKIRFGNDNNFQLISDDRESIGISAASVTHYVTVKQLSPATEYQFFVISNDKEWDNNGTSFTVKTHPMVTGKPSSQPPAYGTIVLPSGEPSEGAIVYLNLGNSGTLSTLTKSKGEWLIALSNARSLDGKTFYQPAEGEQESIVVHAFVGGEAQATTDIENDEPVPSMTIGKQNSFVSQQIISPTTTIKKSFSDMVSLTPTALQNLGGADSEISILVPKNNGSFSSALPLFRGTGVSGARVSITIDSTSQQGTAIVSKDGTWRWTPDKELSPGKYTITIKTTDSDNDEVSKTHTFTIFKSGTQVLGDATPSGILTPTVSPYASPSASFTPSPTRSLSSTISATPVGTRSGQIGGGKMPRSGTVEVTYAILSLGCMFLFAGVVRLLKGSTI